MTRYAKFAVILLVIILIVLISIELRSVKLPTTSAPSPIPTPKNAVSISNPNAQCHAMQVNPTDLQAVLPDPHCTPGATNPAVNQDTIEQTICDPGYTKTIRPPASYTNKLKREQILSYGYPDTSRKDYEEDHFISLELGGSPDDPKNLWPEPHSSPNEKDKVENYLHEQVCNHSITLQQAQKEISTNWYRVYQQLP